MSCTRFSTSKFEIGSTRLAGLMSMFFRSLFLSQAMGLFASTEGIAVPFHLLWDSGKASL